MNKYQFGAIYKITNKLNDEIYVGSTTNDLEVRFIKHKSDAKNRPELSKFYSYMNELGIDNFEIKLIEEYPCDTKEQLRRREGELIQEIGTLNQKIAGRTQAEYEKEYKANHKDKINKRRNERRKENPEKTKAERKKDGALYRERHKEQIQEKAKTKVQCECGGCYTLSHKAEHMQSKKHLKHIGTFNEEEYKNSKRAEQLKNQYDKQKDKLDEEKMKEYKQNWYERNKENMSEKSKERIVCECGMEVCQGAYTRHCKSKHHQNFLKNNIENNVQVPEQEQEVSITQTTSS